jgi:tryptophanyl-tRNA synthetase
MKNIVLFFLISSLFFAGINLIGCQDSGQKVQEAEAKAEAAQIALTKAKQDSIDMARKMVTDEEWQAFKTETQAKIKENNANIATLKANMKKSGKKMDDAYTKNMDAFEQKNKELEAKLDAGYDNGRQEWGEFKREFSHDMDELGQALKDLTVNNKQ